MKFLTYIAITQSNSQLQIEKIIVPDLEILINLKNKSLREAAISKLQTVEEKYLFPVSSPSSEAVSEGLIALEGKEEITLLDIVKQKVNQRIAEILNEKNELPKPTNLEILRKKFGEDINFFNVASNIELKDGPLALTLPKLGVGLSLTASIVSGIIQIVAVSLIAEDQKNAGIGVGITMSLLFVLVNTVVYLYSNTRSDLRELGGYGDALMNCNSVILKDSKPQKALNLKQKFFTYTPYVLFSAIALVATTIDTGTRYKEAEVLADRAHDAGNIIFTRDTIILAAIIQAITNGISEFTVFNSFMRQAAKDISNKMLGQNQLDEDIAVSEGTENTMLIS